MDQDSLADILSNYHTLVKRIENHIHHLENSYPDEIACKKGCDDCCRNLTLFPVEAFCLSLSFVKQKKEIQDLIVQKINTHKDTCPLLIDHTCMLYQTRPVICRTHGYPITMEKENRTQIDFCPKNFKQILSFPKEALLSLEHLNTTLFAINQHFLKSIETDMPLPDRIPMATALFLLEN